MNAKLEEILHQSSQLMAQKTYHGTSMRALADQTGHSVSGLYNYFKSKEELLYLINYHGFSAITGTLRLALEKLQNPRDRLYALIYNHVRYFTAHRDEMKVMMLGTHEMSPDRGRSVRDIKSEYTQIGQVIVREICQAETGVAPDAKELSRKTFLLFGMLNWIFGWYSSKEHGDADELMNDIYTTFLCGLGGEKKTFPNGKAIDALYKSIYATQW